VPLPRVSFGPRPSLPGISTITWAAGAAAILLPVLSWFWWYGGSATLPGLFGNFTASFVAFLIALAWDRRRRNAEVEAAEDQEEEQRKDEAQRRFLTIDLELARLRESVVSVLQRPQDAKYFLPDFPTGSWEAGRGALGLIIGDYVLMADLATLYGRIEDLQWRLRFKAEVWPVNPEEAAAFDPMIEAIATQALSQLDELQPEVQRQIAQPQLLPVTSLRHPRFRLAQKEPLTILEKLLKLTDLRPHS
jgi:hypothetical protein